MELFALCQCISLSLSCVLYFPSATFIFSLSSARSRIIIPHGHVHKSSLVDPHVDTQSPVYVCGGRLNEWIDRLSSQVYFKALPFINKCILLQKQKVKMHFQISLIRGILNEPNKSSGTGM